MLYILCTRKKSRVFHQFPQIRQFCRSQIVRLFDNFCASEIKAANVAFRPFGKGLFGTKTGERMRKSKRRGRRTTEEELCEAANCDEEPTEEVYETANRDEPVDKIKPVIPAIENLGSPFCQRYKKMQDKYPDRIVAFRRGDFYEILGSNAELFAKEFSLTLTGHKIRFPVKTAFIQGKIRSKILVLFQKLAADKPARLLNSFQGFARTVPALIFARKNCAALYSFSKSKIRRVRSLLSINCLKIYQLCGEIFLLPPICQRYSFSTLWINRSASSGVSTVKEKINFSGFNSLHFAMISSDVQS